MPSKAAIKSDKTSKSKATSKASVTAKRASGSSFAFPADAVKFLRELKANNNREWFTENKTRYELSIKQPAADFCEQMTVELEKLTGTPHISKVFRINRDIRFSKDKTPYKAYTHILFRPSDDDNAPKWFFGLEPDQIRLGAGIFGFEKQALDDFRRRVCGPDGNDLAKIITKLDKAGIRIRDPELKRVPSGYPANIAHPELLRHKGLTAWCDHPDGPSAASKPDIVKSAIKSLKSLKPLFDWLHNA